MTAKKKPRHVPVEDAIEDAGISRLQFYDLQTAHGLKVFEINGKLVVDPDAFEAALAELRRIKP